MTATAFTQKEEARRLVQEKRSADFAADLAKMAEGKATAPPKRKLPLTGFASAATHFGEPQSYKLPHGWTYQQALDPEAWSLIAPRLGIATRLRLVPPDVAWEAELTVRALLPGRVIFGEWAYKEYPPIEKLEPEIRGAYVMQDAGLVDNWTVTRLADGRQMVKGLRNRDEARGYIDQLENTSTSSGIVGRA